MRGVLNRYRRELIGFEDKYFTDGIFRNISINDYDKKVLEIVLPNSIITESSLDILRNFEATSLKDYGIEVWYCITK